MVVPQAVPDRAVVVRFGVETAHIQRVPRHLPRRFRGCRLFADNTVPQVIGAVALPGRDGVKPVDQPAGQSRRGHAGIVGIDHPVAKAPQRPRRGGEAASVLGVIVMGDGFRRQRDIFADMDRYAPQPVLPDGFR